MALEEQDRQWIATPIAASEERMLARMEKIETTLLTEFHKWAQPVVSPLRSHSETMRTLDLELEALQSRVERLEGKAS